MYSNNVGGKGGGRGSNVHSFHDLDSGDAPPMTRDKFLAKLPVSVIRYVCIERMEQCIELLLLMLCHSWKARLAFAWGWGI